MEFSSLLTAIFFLCTTAATLVVLYHALANVNRPRNRRNALVIVLALLVWLAVQAGITISGYYYRNIFTDFPPKMLLLGILPTLILIIVVFNTKRGRRFVDDVPVKTLTWLHVVRLPVELVLYLLYVQRAVPQLMTFEGRNFDILIGLSAPLVVHYAFISETPNKKLLLTWNIAGLILLLNVVVHALLSAPGPLQQFAFDQPNVAMVQFPYSWLPTFIVPTVLFSHLVVLRRLI